MILSIICDNLEIPSAEIITGSSISYKSLSLSNVKFFPLIKDWKNTINNKEIIFMPAAIDLHVHFRQPGFEYKETMMTGSLAALHGGCTTVLDMPNTFPATTTLKEFDAKKLLAATEKCNILIAAGISDTNSKEIPELAKVVDFWKVYLDNSFNAVPCKKETLVEACNILTDINNKVPIIIHAMNTPTGNQTIEEEDEGIDIALEIAKNFKKINFHITHLSNASSLEKILKSNLPNVTQDTSPRYFMPKLDHKDLLRCNPPIRSQEMQEKLRRHVKDGKIFMLATDHAPHLIEEKLKGAPGAPGVQELYPLMIDWMLQKNGIDKKLVVKLLHDNPKRLIRTRLLKNEDFILIDKEEQTDITKTWIKSKCGWSLFENKTLKGKIIGIVRK